MNRLTGKIRSFVYPMVGVVLISSLWVMAAEKAKTDQIDNEYVPALHVNAGMPTGYTVEAEPATRP